MNSKAYREFDVDFILKCCKNFLEYLERKRENEIEEHIQEYMNTKKGFFNRRFLTRHEAIEKLNDNSDGFFSEIDWINYSFYSAKNNIDKLIKLCVKTESGISKISIGEEYSYILKYGNNGDLK